MISYEELRKRVKSTTPVQPSKPSYEALRQGVKSTGVSVSTPEPLNANTNFVQRVTGVTPIPKVLTPPSSATPATPNKVSEGEYNRSSAMQTEYGNYRNYLNGIKDTESPAYLNAQLKRMETETAPQYAMPQYPGADWDIMEQAKGKWGEWATLKRKSEEAATAQNLKNTQSDTKLSGTYTSTKDLQSDLDMVRSILMDRTTPTGERNISEYKAAIASKYGVSPSALNDTPQGREDYYQSLEALRDKLQGQVTENAETIAAGGYDYEGLRRYEKQLADKADSEKKTQDAVRFAGTHPVAASAQSVVASAVQPIEFLQMALDGNPYNMDATNFVSAVRGAVSKDIEENTDWGKAGAFLYNVGMSVADSAMLISTLGSSSVYFMGGSAASQRAKEILNKGGSTTQAVLGGVASGAAEAVFEKFSVDRLLSAKDINGIKALLKSVAQQAGTEASEEINTEIANILLDAVIMGNNSDTRNMIADLMLGGATPEEAQRTAIMENIKQVALAGLGGAISGGVMGGFAGAMNYQNTPTQNTQEQSPPTRPLNSTESVVSPVSGIPTTATEQAPQSAPQPVTAQAVATHSETEAFPSIGAADLRFDPYSNLQNQSSAFIPDGEVPYRQVDVPAQNFDGQNVSATVRTAMEAQATPDAAIPTIEQAIANGDFAYTPETNAESLRKATTQIESKGFALALADWTKAIQGKPSAENTALGWALYNSAVNSRDIATAMQVLTDITAYQRSNAQALQAQRILKRMSPEWQLYAARRSVENLTQELVAKYGENAPALTIDPVLAENFINADTPESQHDALVEIYRDIGSQLPSTFADKWNAWRYLSMLGNARTHVRNIGGNAGFAPIRGIKDTLATGLEAAFIRDSSKRTKSILNYTNEADRNLFKAAWQDYAQEQNQILVGGKFDGGINKNSEIQAGRKIFNSSALEAIRHWNSVALDAEDSWFSRPAYAGALAGYLKSQGLTLETASPSFLDLARTYAIKEAQKATYRDTNQFSELMTSIGFKNADTKAKKVANAFIEGTLPFKKTPANILARGVEYSPIGLIKSLSSDLIKVNQGKMEIATALDNIAAGLTGSGLLALGAWLASQGLVTGGGSGDDEEKAYDKLVGRQDYAIEIGGKSITLDWLAPEAIPFFMGVELYVNWQEGERSVWDGLKSLGTAAEPMLEMSMLQSLNNLFEAGRYSEENALLRVITTSATNYFTQALPTLGGQLARTIDGTRRSTYVDPNSEVPDELQYTLQSTMGKIPGASSTRPAFVDAWGRPQTNDNAASRIFGNFLNPAYVSDVNETSVDKELRRLYETVGTSGIFPNSVSVKLDSGPLKGESLTGQEREQFQKTQGQSAYSLMDEFMASDLYNTLTDEQKADVLADINSFSKDKAMRELVTSRGIEYKSDWDDEMSLSDFSAYQAYKTALADAKKGENYDILDALIESMGGQPKEMLDAILDLDGMGKLSQAFKVGITSEQYYDLNDQWRIINAKDKTATEKATEFAVWLDGNSELTPIQRTSVKDFMTFYSMAPASAAQYERLRQNGLSTKTAERIYSNISNLLPEKGKSDVSNAQKYKVILTSGLPEKDQRAALKAYMPETTYEKMESAFDYGVGAKLFVDFNNKKSELTGTGEVKVPLKKWAIQNGMITKQFNQLWLLYYPKD